MTLATTAIFFPDAWQLSSTISKKAIAWLRIYYFKEEGLGLDPSHFTLQLLGDENAPKI